MNNKQQALESFRNGLNCSQAVLGTFAEKCGISKGFAIKMGTAFGAGMGRNQIVCGAVSGAFMVFSLLYGNEKAGDETKKEMVYSKVKEFTRLFKEKFGTVICFKLLDNCDLNTSEGQERYHNEHMSDRCCNYIRSSIEIIEKLIDD